MEVKDSFIFTSSNQDYSFICYEFEGKKIKPKFYKEKIDELSLFPQNVPGRAPYFPFGIAKNEKFIYVISHTNLAHFDAETYEYLGLIKECKTGVNSHQMIIDEDNPDLLYICNTSNDSLTIFNLKTKENKYVLLKDSIDEPFQIVDTIDFKFDVYVDDNYHINSICQYKDSLFFVLSFKEKAPSKILEISKKDYQPLSIIENVGQFNHDIIVTDEYIYSLSTKTGELVEYHRNDKTITKYNVCMDNDYWWLRGMKRINDSIYVFIGENWKTTIKIPMIVVKEFDMNSKKMLSTNLIALKASCYQVI